MDLDSTAGTSPDVVIPSTTAPIAEPIQHVIEPTAPAAPPKVKSMDDTIREKFREMNKPPEPLRGVDGKFQKPADLAGAAVAEEPVEAVAAEPVVEEPAAVVEEPVVAPVDPALEKAPSSWRKEAQAKWAATDPQVREEILRREADFHKGLETYKGWAKVGQDLDSEIRPYEAMIRAAGTNPQAIIKDVFNTIYQLKTGSPEQKAAVALNILSEYGVDLEAVQQASERVAAGQQPVVQDPRVEQLAATVQQLQKQNEEREQSAQKEQFAAVASEVESFKKAPGHEHYEAVKIHMAALVESGVCSTLQDAYDQAIWANPAVRAKLEAEQQKTRRAQAAEKAAAAKKASSVNVVPRGTLPSAPKVGTMEETIRNTLKSIKARGDA